MQTTIDITGLITAEAIHDEVARALHLPDYYGKNLDALWDCLGDLDMPLTITWKDGGAATEEARAAGQAIHSLFLEFAAEESRFQIRG